MVAETYSLVECIAKKITLPSDQEWFVNESDDDVFYYGILRFRVRDCILSGEQEVSKTLGSLW